VAAERRPGIAFRWRIFGAAAAAGAFIAAEHGMNGTERGNMQIFPRYDETSSRSRGKWRKSFPRAIAFRVWPSIRRTIRTTANISNGATGVQIRESEYAGTRGARAVECGNTIPQRIALESHHRGR